MYIYVIQCIYMIQCIKHRTELQQKGIYFMTKTGRQTESLYNELKEILLFLNCRMNTENLKYFLLFSH